MVPGGADEKMVHLEQGGEELLASTQCIILTPALLPSAPKKISSSYYPSCITEMHPYPVPPHRCIILSIGPIPASPLADASYHFTHLHLQSAPRNRPQAQIHLAPSMNSTSTLRFLVFPTLSHLFMIAFKYLLAAVQASR